jgi:transcriptional regulator with PAS, ATPase and Fis domain
MLEGFAQLMAVAIENSRDHEKVLRANEALFGENLALRQEVASRFQPKNMIGTSAGMQRVLSQIAQVANFDTTVLLTGENGTGKDLLARVLHGSSNRKLQPFVTVDCGALPASLIESELFGILGNVATDVRGRAGKFQLADGGTLFLNEIGEMPLAQQVALLNAISNREVTPIGGRHPIPVNVRIIAATNRDLAKMVDEGRFRVDLYYRLNVVQIDVPPLRERKADIPALAQFFVARFAALHKRPVPQMSPDFMAALMQSDWPGNVRQLENYLERLMTLSTSSVLRPEPPPPDLVGGRGAPRGLSGRRLAAVIEELEREMIREALRRSRGNQSLAARDLGLTEQSMRYRIRKYGLPDRRSRRTRRFSR